MEQDKRPRSLLRLYVTGNTPRSERAIANLEYICTTELADEYTREVIDVLTLAIRIEPRRFGVQARNPDSSGDLATTPGCAYGAQARVARTGAEVPSTH